MTDDIVGHIQLVGNEAANARRAIGIHFHADHRAAAAALQGAFEHAHKVFGLFLDFDIAVPDDAEQALPQHVVAGEQCGRKHPQHVFQRDEARARMPGSRMKRSSCCGMGSSAFMMPPSRRRFSSSAMMKPRLGMKGKGWAGSMAMGVTMGRMCSRKRLSSHLCSSAVRSSSLDDGDAVFGQFAFQLQPAPVLLGHQFLGKFPDLLELLCRVSGRRG